MDDNSLMPFGMYSKKPLGPLKLANVPADYLLFLLRENKCYGQLKDYIIENKEVLLKEAANKNKFLSK